MRLLAILAATAVATPATAQDSGWDYSTTFYAWLPALTAEIDTAFGTVEVEQSISDVLDQLRFAAFASIEARNGRWGLIGDLAYADLAAKKSLPAGGPFGRARSDTNLAVVSAYGAYRVHQTPTVMVDFAAGVRVYDLSLGLDLSGGAAPPQNLSFSSTWIDPVIGIRGSWNMSGRWRAGASLDAGGFGLGDASDLSWQAVGEVEYRFADTWSAVTGYRHISIDRPFGGRDVTLEISGPYIGLRARF